MIEVIQAIDPSLRYVEEFDASLCVYRVRKDGVDRILKLCDPLFRLNMLQLENERRARLLLEGIDGVTHIVHDYGDQRRTSAILKEYFDGTDVYSGWPEDPRLQEMLEETVMGIHDLGIVTCDLNPGNIVVSPNGQNVKIIEIGACKFLRDIGEREFEKEMSKDLTQLEDLFNGVPIC